MKTTLRIAVATALSLPVISFAEPEQLTTIIIEGSASRPGAFALTPDSSGLKEGATRPPRKSQTTFNCENAPSLAASNILAVAG